ncbi:glycosyltransferase [Mesobacillus boroniphilus]|uniref:Capsular polysaccharide biosynthsis protein n=1 Tax=Mesobacillus boroniphilus JCM 21738 TaxID=1294265 RepID=W4RIQ7_9BACI|nr:glycosyltransferase [Mesobacillus boroniphilus]GAE44191.1 capsular polysaccharide biosynthsis protein [Mesobacillus boroniphilus JCM 21738]
MKKILFMLSSMNIGGVEKSFLSLLSTLDKEKFDVTLLLLEKKGEFLSFLPDWIKVKEASWFGAVKPVILQPPKKTVHEYFVKGEYQRIPGFITTYFISKKLDDRYLYYKHVLKNIPPESTKYDLAIAIRDLLTLLIIIFLTKSKQEKKISWIHFDVSNHKINKNLYERLYRKFHELVVVSEEARKQLVRLIPSAEGKTRIVPNIIDDELIIEMSKEAITFDPNYKGLKILTVGRLSEEKGQDLAVRVLSKLRENGYNVRWYCIGEGKYRDNLESLIKEFGVEENFILLGSKNNPYPYMAQADIYVQTSRHEGFCLTLAEAKCLSKPIVTTNFIGAIEQIIDGENGYIVNVHEDEIYSKVKLLLENKEIRDYLSDVLSKDIQKREVTQFSY